MIDDQAVAPTLGRRLDALARSRLHAWAPQPAWAAPFAVALRHTEGVADVLGERFERTETLPRTPAERPFDLTDLPVARPGTRAERQGRAAPKRPARDGGRNDETRPQPWLPEEEGAVRTPDDDLREIPADVRSRLRREVGPAADLMRVHAGPEADAQARVADADAVTTGRDAYLRQGRWAPRREDGVALLAHEATHVAALVDPGSVWRRSLGDPAEEAVARARERSVLGLGAAAVPVAPVPDGLAAPMRTAALGTAPGHREPVPALTAESARPAPAAASSAPSASPAAAVQGAGMRASVDRDLAPPAPAVDLDALRRGVIAEVMQRLRSEIERGA